MRDPFDHRGDQVDTYDVLSIGKENWRFASLARD